MSDYSELKPLLDACLDEKNNDARSFRKACDALFDVCTIEMIAALVADNDALRDGANFRAIQSLRQDCEALRKDAQRYRWIRKPGCNILPLIDCFGDDMDKGIDADMAKAKL